MAHQEADASTIETPAFDIDRVSFAYDRDSDTLMLHLALPVRMATSKEVARNLYARIDRETDELVGFQVENFLRAVAPRHPAMLDHPEVLGITLDDIAAARPKPWWKRMRPAAATRQAESSRGDPVADKRTVFHDIDRAFGRRMTRVPV